MRKRILDDYDAVYAVLADSDIMEHTNIPSCKTAISCGCRQVDEYKDDGNEITRVFAITRKE